MELRISGAEPPASIALDSCQNFVVEIGLLLE